MGFFEDAFKQIGGFAIDIAPQVISIFQAKAQADLAKEQAKLLQTLGRQPSAGVATLPTGAMTRTQIIQQPFTTPTGQLVPSGVNPAFFPVSLSPGIPRGGATVAQFLPGGAPVQPAALGGALLRQLPGLGAGAAITEFLGGGGSCPTLFRPGQTSVRAVRQFMVMHPETGQPVWYVNRGRPVLYSGDLAACGRVTRVARRVGAISRNKTVKRAVARARRR